MITDSNKRQAGLTLLQRLRHQGLPDREEKMESMFDSIAGGDEGEGDDEYQAAGKPEMKKPEYEEMTPEEEERYREEKRKQKGPSLEPKKVDKFKKGFMSVP